MNDLSLLLYFADVAERARVISLFLLIPLAGIFLIGIFVISMEDGAKEATDFAKFFGRVIKRIKLTFILALVVAVISPTKTTVYLIAASEIGEDVIGSPLADKIAAYIDRALPLDSD